MVILITGAYGLVGSRIVELNQHYQLLTPQPSQFNLTKPHTIQTFLHNYHPEVIINFAAFTNVSEAEQQRGNRLAPCWQINVEGIQNLLAAIDSTKTHFIHISTDMVFSGSVSDPGPYTEDHLPETDSSQLTWYGFSKAEAERLIPVGTAAIIRLIYPVRAKFEPKLDYLRKPLQLYNQGKLYPLFNDQQISITFIDELYTALSQIIAQKLVGIYHVSSPDTTTPFELISYLLTATKGVNNVVQSSSIDSMANPVRYPKFGGLKVNQTESRLGIKFSPWQKIVKKLIKQGLS